MSVSVYLFVCLSVCMYQQFICATHWKMEVSTYTADFEIAIAKTMKAQFSRGLAVQCLFHLRHRWRRKLLEFDLPKDAVSRLLTLMNVLTVIPINEIKTKEIQYYRSKMDEVGHEIQYDGPLHPSLSSNTGSLSS